jgi:peptidoglycan/xylan/chitin deacetylase (PgdA/CDA1 family)
MKTEWLAKAAGNPLFMPFYHAVSDEELIHIRHLYVVPSVARFRADLDFIQKKFIPVQATDLLENAGKAASLPANRCFLSFDDGLREFYDVIAPILLQRGIPAAFFVNSDFVGNKDLFYRYKVSILIDRLEQKGISGAQEGRIAQICQTQGKEFKSAPDLLKITYRERAILEEIAQVLEVSFTDYLAKQQPYLTPEQIRWLIDKGFTPGGHSASHPLYYQLPEEEQVRETLDSLNFLQDHFQVKSRFFAFPFTDFGVKRSFYEKIRAEVDLTFGTAGFKYDPQGSDFQRTGMEGTRFESAEALLRREFLMSSLKRILGKQTIKRD